jgi:hypothetical protein
MRARPRYAIKYNYDIGQSEGKQRSSLSASGRVRNKINWLL